MLQGLASIDTRKALLNMTDTTPRGAGVAGCALLLLSFIVLPTVRVAAATTPIYKCFDKNLGLLYTDEPCKDGELLNLRAGDADPAAVARLERARDALDQSAAERIADNRRAATQRDLALWYANQDPRIAYGDLAANAAYDYGMAWWFPGFAHFHPRSRAPRPLEPRHFAIQPRHMVPRR
jgi:hypothetical protein